LRRADPIVAAGSPGRHALGLAHHAVDPLVHVDKVHGKRLDGAGEVRSAREKPLERVVLPLFREGTDDDVAIERHALPPVQMRFQIRVAPRGRPLARPARPVPETDAAHSGIREFFPSRWAVFPVYLRITTSPT
jgi:hypothetical protein